MHHASGHGYPSRRSVAVRDRYQTSDPLPTPGVRAEPKVTEVSLWQMLFRFHPSPQPYRPLNLDNLQYHRKLARWSASSTAARSLPQLAPTATAADWTGPTPSTPASRVPHLQPMSPYRGLLFSDCAAYVFKGVPGSLPWHLGYLVPCTAAGLLPLARLGNPCPSALEIEGHSRVGLPLLTHPAVE